MTLPFPSGQIRGQRYALRPQELAVGQFQKDVHSIISLVPFAALIMGRKSRGRVIEFSFLRELRLLVSHIHVRTTIRA